MILDWRDARKDHRKQLKAFTCTTTPPREPDRRAGQHPKPWEYAVQKAIHQLRVPMPAADGRCMIGLNEDGEIRVCSRAGSSLSQCSIEGARRI